MKLSIIIINYNVQYFLEQALLAAQRAANRVSSEIYVVDNNSKDGSVAMVQKKFPSVKLIANTDNPGFSKANNQAIKQAEGEYILLLNPDTIVAEDTFSKCIEFMDTHADCGGLGIKMIDGGSNFLPESKRGFPSPFVAFCKTFGLSTLFPKSTIFNQYHLGFLDKEKNHTVDVLAGAFMMVRKETIDKIGMLDETFFMYGEDIDWSYRIKQAGYENYYFADSTIIHYKGESTKKGSLNYVKVFYQAMIIFARKHFTGSQGKFFVFILQLAIYFRALLTLVSNLVKRLAFPLLDAILIGVGLFLLKNFWAVYYFKDPNYYSEAFLWFNIPLYTIIWLASIYFSGGYDNVYRLNRHFKGLLGGAIIISALYGFLNEEFRSSRMLIVLGAVWTFITTFGSRLLLHFLKYRNFNLHTSRPDNVIIVGKEQEVERTLKLLQKAQINKNIIGSVSPSSTNHDFNIGTLENLQSLTQLYKVNEIIFCSKDLSYKSIIENMEQLGTAIQYRILPENSTTIIGSHSKNTSGNLYTVDIPFNLSEITHRRNKRLLDIFISVLSILFFPILLLFVQQKISFIRNIFQVLFHKKTWVGYTIPSENLPAIPSAVLNATHRFPIINIDKKTQQKMDFLYAKDYQVVDDLRIIWKGIQYLGS